MHKFLRAIGFSQYKTDAEFRPVLDKVLAESKEVFSFSRATTEKGVFFIGEFGKDFGLKLFTSSIRDRVREQYYFPYFDSNVISSEAQCRIEKKSDGESYLGMIEVPNFGSSLIFHVSNPDFYERGAENSSHEDGKYASFIKGVALTGFSTDGKIILPVKKSVREVEYVNNLAQKKDQLYEAAGEGDVDAMDIITIDDITLSTTILEMINNNVDIYSIVDTCFMPSGMESVKYMLIGEIAELELVRNSLTGELIYRMIIISNDIPVQVVINSLDLLGEPSVGRRFKGYVALEGRLR